MFSAVDAKYSFFFNLLMHELWTPFYNLTSIIHNLTVQVIVGIVSATEYEAYYIGIFFNHLLYEIKWWREKTTYERECFETPGFDQKNNDT